MRERIKKTIKNVLEIDTVPDNICQMTCVEWDSMNHLRLVVELESEFGVSFDPLDIVELDSLDAIENKIKVYSGK
jgi:acyl carrier protein